ncbi:Zinc finger CCCH domain-containing protein 11A [Sarcoptes scabiei]|nr:Zinc finger CCCH domain-containing protein 11A [Sarcoptes scabiei]
MPVPIRPQITDFIGSLSSRINDGLREVSSSIRSFGNSCNDRLQRLSGQQSSSGNSTNPENPIIDSNENDTQSPTVAPDAQTSTTDHFRNFCRRSSSQNRHSNHYRDREYHNAYHLYRNALISVQTIDKDRNVLAAVLSIIVIAILATALAQPKWFSIYNDLCAPRYLAKSSDQFEPSKSSIITDDGIPIFDLQYYQNGPFHSSSYVFTPITIYGLTPDYKICANPQILALKRTIIGLCFLAIMCTLIQFFMDTIGTRKKWANAMRVYAVGNIICVLLCIMIIGLCYFISILYERMQLQQLFTKQQTSPFSLNSDSIRSRMIGRTMASNQLDYLTIHQIEVKFELSYYLVTLAGFISILASAANLFRRPRQIFIERISGINNYHNNLSHCLSRPTRSALSALHRNGDESLLLGSDSLNAGCADSPSTSAANRYFSPYSCVPNDWLFNRNWNLFYHSTDPSSLPSYHSNHQRQAFDQRNVINSSNSTMPSNENRLTANTQLPSMPSVPVPCPPPPPYSP